MIDRGTFVRICASN